MGCKLHELVSLVRGNTYKSKLLGNNGPALLGLGTITRNGGFNNSKLRYYPGETSEKIRPFAVWCGWVCQVVTVLRSSLPQVR